MLSDLRLALRLLLKAPAFSAIAILALALGIGANTAIFSVVDAVLLRPLPYQDAGRLAMVWEDGSLFGFPRNTPAPANWADWRNQNTVFTDIAASRGATYNITGEGTPEQVFARRVSANFWTVLGSQPHLGRVFTEQEDVQQSAVVVISHGLWQRRFGGARDILGRSILLNGLSYQIVGVMPPDFYFLPTRLIDVWTPISFTPQDIAARGSHYLHCVARLKPGVSIDQARAEMSAIGKRIADQYPNMRGVGATVVPLREQLAGNTRLALIVLLCGAGCVLLIACANIANLLLARGAARQRELAVRSALGASRSRLIRQLLTESMLLSVFGALAGLLLARLSLAFLDQLIPQTMLAPPLSLDPRMLLFTACVALAAALLFGALPAVDSARVSLHDTIKQGGRGSFGARRHWLRDSLVVAETALAVLLLTGAGLLFQTLHSLQQTDLGMKTENLLTALTFPDPKKTHPQREVFYNAVLERARAIPGVLYAGFTSTLPLTERGNTSGYIFEGQSEAETHTQDALFRVVSTDYHRTVGARLREGRFFSRDDRSDTQPAAIVNETFADRHFRGQSALGKRFQMGRWGREYPWYSIVGVVREIRERGIDVDLKPGVYLVHPQAASAWPIPSTLIIRTAVEPASITSQLREAVWAVDKNQPVSRVRTMDAVVNLELAAPKQNSILLAVFAALALLLACLGIYGVLSYAVTQRTNEIGLRMALGATSSNILALVAQRGLILTLAGLAIGIAASLAASRLIENLLFGVKPNDPATLIAVSATLLTVALAAAMIPALRASRIDPLAALREE